MKLVSWNVNGMRAILSKNFLEVFALMDADIFCMQETKMQEGQATIELSGYQQYWNSAIKKGYSGTAIFTRITPLNVSYNLAGHDQEGRLIALEFEDFYLINVYTPNSQEKLARISYRLNWESDFRNYLVELRKKKPVIICGDLNVAHQEIDLKNPKANSGNAGFSDEERNEMTALLQSGFIDSFRYFYPTIEEAYSWWSYRFQARSRNAGWRIDYFLVDELLRARLQKAEIHADITGSDHCPVSIVLD
ncbi:MAG: exodeoxyribonuclease III [Clostridia bacterium]